MKMDFRFLLVCDYNRGQMSLASKTNLLRRDPIFVRNLVFGVEDGLVSTAGFLSESSVEALDGKKILIWESVLGGVVMFLSYAVAGFTVVSPYFFLPIARAMPVAVATTLLMLAVLGFVSSRLSGRNSISRILRMVIVGGLAVIFGVSIGQLVS